MPRRYTLAELNRINDLRAAGKEWDEVAAGVPGCTPDVVRQAAIAYRMPCVTERDLTLTRERAAALDKVFAEHPEWTDKQAGAVLGWDKQRVFYYRKYVCKLPDRAGRLYRLANPEAAASVPATSGRGEGT